MISALLLLLLINFKAIAEPEPTASELENQELQIEVRHDASYSILEKDVLLVNGPEKVERVTYEADLADVEVVAAGISEEGHETPVSIDKVRKREIASQMYRLEIPFTGLGPKAQIWYQLKRTPKVHELSGFFSMDVIYGFLHIEKKGRVQISSELPLYFQVHDPEDALEIENHNDDGKFTLDIRLTKPVYGVTPASLRQLSQEELRQATTRVQISNAKDWSEVSQKVRAVYQDLLNGPAPQELATAAAPWSHLASPRAKVEKILLWLAEQATYSGSWQSSIWRPHTLDYILKQREGDSKDLTLLALALLRAVGVEAEPVYVGLYSDQDHSRFLHAPISEQSPAPSTTYFNHVVLRYKQEGRWITVDPTRGLGDSVHLPYYLHHMWALNLADQTVAKLRIPETSSARAEIHTQLTRQKDGAFAVHSIVNFHGELGNFLRMIYFKDGEIELQKYLEAFASVTPHNSFTYRKIDFVDRQPKNFAVELAYTANDPVKEPRKLLNFSPPYLANFISQETAGALHFPQFPMQITETITIPKSVVEREERYDCVVRGPLAGLDRRIENRGGAVLINTELKLPTMEMATGSKPDQIIAHAHLEDLKACADNAVLSVAVLHPPMPVPFEDQVDTTTGYSPVLSRLVRVDLVTELRRLDVYLSRDNKNADLWLERGKIFRRLAHVDGETYNDEYLEEAENCFLKAVTLSPSDSSAHGQLGINYFYRGQLSQSIAVLHRSWALDPQNFALLQLNGLVAAKKGNQELASSYFASAVRYAKTPEDKAWALSREALAVAQQGDYKKATELLQLAMQTDTTITAMFSDQLGQWQERQPASDK